MAIRSAPRARLARAARRAAAVVFLVVSGAAPASAAGFDADLWDAILARHTVATDDTAGTRVAYAALARDPDWPRLLASLAASDPAALPSRDARLALWINAYNVLAIDVVVKGQPVASIRDLGSLLRPVWKREAGRVGGQPVTLDEIEHERLRPMGEPRIHAAIVCASTSCPSLRREAYRAERLGAQLDDSVRRWLADPRKGLRVEPDRVWLSSIFDWFGEDFAAAGGPLGFARPYLAPPVRAALDRLGPEPRIAWLDYDWTLNDAAAR